VLSPRRSPGRRESLPHPAENPRPILLLVVKTGGRLIKHARYYWLLLAESHLTRRLFAGMLRKITQLAAGRYQANDRGRLHRAARRQDGQASVKQHLAAVRQLFDYLVTGGILPSNPAGAVRGPKYVVKRGKTPVLSADQARQLLDSIDVTELSGLRDRALIGVMVYSFARVSAVAMLRVEDYFENGKRAWLRLYEKAASVTKCRTIIILRPTWMPGSMRPALPPKRKGPSSGRLGRETSLPRIRWRGRTF